MARSRVKLGRQVKHTLGALQLEQLVTLQITLQVLEEGLKV